MVIWFATSVSVLLPGGSLAAGEANAVLKDGGGFDCLPISVFGLSGIRLWQPRETVERTLGKPETITEGWGEDDGGRYTVHTYHYSFSLK